MVAISTVAKTKNLVRKKVALWKTVFVAPRSPAIWRWIEFPTSYMVNRGFLCCSCGGRKVLFKEVSIFVRLSFFALCSNNTRPIFPPKRPSDYVLTRGSGDKSSSNPTHVLFQLSSSIFEESFNLIPEGVFFVENPPCLGHTFILGTPFIAWE